MSNEIKSPELKKYSEIKASDFENPVEAMRASLLTKRTSLKDNGEFTCVSMVANEIDAHGDLFTVECVEKAYVDYVTNYNGLHGTQHSGNEIDSFMLSHWYTRDGGMFDGVEAPKNSVIMKFQINDEDVRKQYKDGTLTGVSIEAKATTVQYSKLEEQGYTIDDITSLTKSKVKNSKFDKPKRIIIKADITKIDFVDMGANLRAGLYKAEKFDAGISEFYDSVNDILEDELTPSIKFSVAKNINLKNKRAKIFGIKPNPYKGFYYDGIESYDLTKYLDPVNLEHEVATNEQMSKVVGRWYDLFYDQEDFKVIKKRLAKILLENDYDISYDYIKTNLIDFDEDLLKQLKDKYNTEPEESVKLMDNKELLEAVRAVVNEVMTAKAAEQVELQKQEQEKLALEKQEQEKLNLEKQEQEKLQAKIAELEAKVIELSKEKEAPVTEVEVAKAEVVETVEDKIAKAVEARLSDALTRLTSNSNTEVKKTETKIDYKNHPAGNFADFF